MIPEEEGKSVKVQGIITGIEKKIAVQGVMLEKEVEVQWIIPDQIEKLAKGIIPEKE